MAILSPKSIDSAVAAWADPILPISLSTSSCFSVIDSMSLISPPAFLDDLHGWRYYHLPKFYQYLIKLIIDCCIEQHHQCNQSEQSQQLLELTQSILSGYRQHHLLHQQ